MIRNITGGSSLLPKHWIIALGEIMEIEEYFIMWLLVGSTIFLIQKLNGIPTIQWLMLTTVVEELPPVRNIFMANKLLSTLS